MTFACATGFALPDGVTTLEIGARAPAFDLPGADGQRYSLEDFSGAEVLVVVFTCNHCPTAQAYEDRLIALHADYAPRNVAVVAISPNDPLAVRLDELGYSDVNDSLEDMKLRAQERGFRFPYLYDGETQAVSRAYGPVATPHVFVFDRDRILRYTGRIDDSERADRIQRRDTRDAIDALLGGQPVSDPVTRVFGCSTKWSDKRASAEESLRKWNSESADLKRVGADELRAICANASGDGKLRVINVWATWCGPYRGQSR